MNAAKYSRLCIVVGGFLLDLRLPLGGTLGVLLALLYPKGLTVAQVLALPKGGAGLERVDNKFARSEGLGTVATGHGQENNLIAIVQSAHTMDNPIRQDVPAFLCRGTDALDFALAHPRVML